MSAAIAIKCEDLDEDLAPIREADRILLPLRPGQPPLHPTGEMPRLQRDRTGPRAICEHHERNPGIEGGAEPNRIFDRSGILGILIAQDGPGSRITES